MLELRLSGTGGQGLILAGIILAEAAILDNKMAIQSQSYGPEARGGSSKSEVIIDTKPIHYPKIVTPNLVLAMSQESCNKYTTDLPESGILVTDKLFVSKLPDKKFSKIYELPITTTAKDVLGKALFSNIIALGAIVKITDCVSLKSLETAVLDRVPKGTEEMNQKAIQLGLEMVNT